MGIFVRELSPEVSVALAMKIWLLLFLLTHLHLTTWTIAAQEKNYQNEFSPKIVRSSRVGSFDISKITGWTNTDNVAAFTLTVMVSQIIVATGWLIFGTLWYILAVMTASENANMH